MPSVLFICSGNICRSPVAEGLFRQLVEKRGLADSFSTDSAGTDVLSRGQAPHAFAIAACAKIEIDIAPLTSRSVIAADFRQFDYLLAMDEQVLSKLTDWRPRDFEKHLGLLRDFTPGEERGDVPDPISGDQQEFENTLKIITAACEGLLDAIAEQP